uniref:Uncharacterized protein n=1 Tax=Octopus bimaculoides TaxID=37653 RepID=A0A0L8G0E6_OCTBM
MQGSLLIECASFWSNIFAACCFKVLLGCDSISSGKQVFVVLFSVISSDVKFDPDFLHLCLRKC